MPELIPAYDTTMDSSPAPDPLEAARKVVEADKEKRGKACMDEIKQVMAKHKCQMRLDVVIGGENIPLAQVLAFPCKMAIIPD